MVVWFGDSCIDKRVCHPKWWMIRCLELLVGVTKMDKIRNECLWGTACVRHERAGEGRL